MTSTSTSALKIACYVQDKRGGIHPRRDWFPIKYVEAAVGRIVQIKKQGGSKSINPKTGGVRLDNLARKNTKGKSAQL